MEAFDWNGQQHIIRRYTEEEIRNVLEAVAKPMQELQRANESFEKDSPNPAATQSSPHGESEALVGGAW
jgi:hypothetical protein